MLNRRWFPYVPALAITLLVGLSGSYAVRMDQARQAGEQRHHVVGQVAKYRAALEGEINASLHLTDGLAAYVAMQPKLSPTTANTVLKALYARGRHIRNLALAPDNRLRYVYPLQGNEQALGLYYPDLPDQWPAVERAIRERRPTLAGPVQLKQGGTGFIYRVPVFTESSGDYWGLLSLVVEKDSLLSRAGLAAEADGLRFALRGQDGRGTEGATFLGDPALFQTDAVTAIIELPGGSWQLAAQPIAGWPNPRSPWLHASAWGAAALFGLAYYLVLASLARRTQAERIARHSRDELVAAQRVAGLGSWWADLKNHHLTWSDETYRIFGVEKDAPVSLDDFIARVHPDDRDRVLGAWQAALKSGDYVVEHRILVATEVKWVQERARIERALDGTPLYGIGTTLDITARKIAELERQVAEDRLREAQRIAQVGNWELDLSSGAITCSEELLRVLELPPEHGPLNHDAFINAIHPEDREWVITSHQTAIKTGRPFDLTHRLVADEGIVKYVHLRGEAICAADGTPIRLRGTMQDVTMEKLAEEALRESEQRFKTVADYNYGWEYWRGPNGEFLYLSPACEQITGYSQYELISDPGLTERIVHPEDRALVDGHMQDYQSDQPHQLDFRIVTKSGDIRWITHGCRPVFGAHGEFQGRRVSNRDITDRKNAESALNDAKDRLELAIEASQLSIWEVDIASDQLRFDAAWSDAIGLITDQPRMTLAATARCVHPDDWSRVMDAFVATFKGIAPSFHVEFRWKSRNADWVWLRCSGKVVERDAQGRAVRALGTAIDVSQRKATEEMIRQMAFHDHLTQLPNRRLLEDRLQQLIAQAQRDRLGGLSLLFIDIDKFKPINDQLGHDVGDWLLKRVADRMRQCLRESDTVARVGGDEFIVLLPEAASADDATRVAEKIRQTLEQPFVDPKGRTLSISSSIGVAIYPEHADNPRDLMRFGDEAMYRTKKAGRNAVTVFQAVPA